MKKLILLFALILNFSAFSQELKKDTTIKVIKKSEKGSPGVKHYFDHHYGYIESVQCRWISSKGVRCKNSSAEGACNLPNCASRK
jgi:hypothetical protein